VIAWLVENYAKAQAFLLIMAWAGIMAATVAIIWVCSAAYRRINDLKDV